MSWKVQGFQVPNHPNWTGKSHRSSQEAFGGFQYHERSQRLSTGWGGVILGVLLILVALAGFIPRESRALTTDYARRSLNKTIVVDKGSTSTRYESSGGTQVETRKSSKKP